MDLKQLAILGGVPILDGLSPYKSIGQEEKDAVIAVLDSQCLSGFYGSPSPEFLGGPKIRQFEGKWCERYGCDYAVSVNSATSGLIAAMGAIGVSPGDEVIVPPWTMSATVMAPLFYGAIPVFADIELETFCIDPNEVSKAITSKTRAILAVNLFGHPAQLDRLRHIADQNGIYLIEDNSQSPLGMEHTKYCGTVGDIGVFSLNYHKHIHSGEGGMCVTDNLELAQRLQFIRNHGENLVESEGITDSVNLIGQNLRMTEMSAAVGIAQLDRIDEHVTKREWIAESLSRGTEDLEGWQVPVVREGCRHNYYCWVVRYDAGQVGISRETFSKALSAEGFPHSVGYVKPLYTLPLFRDRIAIGRSGFPFNLTKRQYYDGLCPITERMHQHEAVIFEPCAWDINEAEMEQLITSLRKVHSQADKLKPLDGV